MDWLEELVQKMKQRSSKLSLAKSLLYTVLFWLFVALTAYILTKNVCSSWFQVIAERYSAGDEYIQYIYSSISPSAPLEAQVIMTVLKLLYVYSLLIFVVIFEYIGIRLFFKNKLMPGFDSLHTTLGYMTLGDLSHESGYSDENEIGMLSRDVEKLRIQLVQEKRKEWEMQAEQSSINAAFAHDLRTPLTVMKGYTEFLLKYQPQGKVSEEALLEKLEILLQHQERLLAFSKTMTEIQNMEMRQLHCTKISYKELMNRLQTTLEELEKQKGKKLILKTQSEEMQKDSQILLDVDLVMEVCENQVSNALRYANKQIEVRCNRINDKLTIYVHDDGKGFSPTALRQAKTLYFSEEKGTSNHFGMGLYICEKICEKHGGGFSILNSTEGGGISAAEFKIGN